MAKANLQMMAVMDRENLRSLNERDFSIAIREYAESHDWLCHYQGKTGGFGRDGKTWRSNAPKGFPDLLMIRADRCVVAELKAERGKATPEQELWLSALTNAGISAFLWRPRDAAAVIERLR